MLVISRKPGESFVVGDAVVTILRSKQGAIRIGVEAQREVRVMRSELLTRKANSDGQRK